MFFCQNIDFTIFLFIYFLFIYLLNGIIMDKWRRNFMKTLWNLALLTWVSWFSTTISKASSDLYDLANQDIEPVLLEENNSFESEYIKKIQEELKKYYPYSRKGVNRNDRRILHHITNTQIYWRNLPKNIPWTFIQQGLWNIKFPEKVETNEAQIYVSKINWKVILRFYIDWKLDTACYVSPWRYSRRTPAVNKYPDRDLDIDHISLWKERAWAVMPYAIHVIWWVWIHWSTGIIDWKPHSHGCIRTWLFFIKHIYDTLNERWLWKKVKINTKGIY